MMDLDWVGEKGGQVCGIINSLFTHSSARQREKDKSNYSHDEKVHFPS